MGHASVSCAMAIVRSRRGRAVGVGLLVLCMGGTWLAWDAARESRLETERVRAEQAELKARTAAEEAAREKASSEAKAMQDALDAAKTDAERREILEKYRGPPSAGGWVGRPRPRGEWTCPPNDPLCEKF